MSTIEGSMPVPQDRDPGVGHNGGPPLDITGQTIFRVVNPNKAYTKISNVLLSDREINFACKGFLVSILMLPVDWAFRVTWLSTTFGIGEDKAYGLVKEAIQRGYCRRVRVRSKSGTVARFEYHFADDPAELKTSTAPLPEKPEVDQLSPLPEKPEVACRSPSSGKSQVRQKPVLAGASSGKSGCIQRKDSDKGLKDTNSPPPPQTRQRRVRGARERDCKSRSEEWLEQLRADQTNGHVVEHLIVLLMALRVDHDDPIMLLRSIRDHRSIADKPPRLLSALARRLTTTRKVLCSTKDVVDEVNAATQVEPMLRITPASPSWEAWLDHHRQQSGGFLVKAYTEQASMPVWTEWPPTHERGAAA